MRGDGRSWACTKGQEPYWAFRQTPLRRYVWTRSDTIGRWSINKIKAIWENRNRAVWDSLTIEALGRHSWDAKSGWVIDWIGVIEWLMRVSDHQDIYGRPDVETLDYLKVYYQCENLYDKRLGDWAPRYMETSVALAQLVIDSIWRAFDGCNFLSRCEEVRPLLRATQQKMYRPYQGGWIGKIGTTPPEGGILDLESYYRGLRELFYYDTIPEKGRKYNRFSDRIYLASALGNEIRSSAINTLEGLLNVLDGVFEKYNAWNSPDLAGSYVDNLFGSYNAVKQTGQRDWRSDMIYLRAALVENVVWCEWENCYMEGKHEAKLRLSPDAPFQEDNFPLEAPGVYSLPELVYMDEDEDEDEEEERNEDPFDNDFPPAVYEEFYW